MATLVKPKWIDAVDTAPFTGDPIEVLGATEYVIQVAWTGSPTQAVAGIEGSIDGETWTALAVAAIQSGGTPQTVWVTGKPVKYVRPFVFEMSGGTSPTVTVSALID